MERGKITGTVAVVGLALLTSACNLCILGGCKTTGGAGSGSGSTSPTAGEMCPTGSLPGGSTPSNGESYAIAQTPNGEVWCTCPMGEFPTYSQGFSGQTFSGCTTNNPNPPPPAPPPVQITVDPGITEDACKSRAALMSTNKFNWTEINGVPCCIIASVYNSDGSPGQAGGEYCQSDPSSVVIQQNTVLKCSDPAAADCSN